MASCTGNLHGSCGFARIFFSYAVLICTFPAAPIYNCLVFNHSPLFDYMANAFVFIAPLLYALVIYLAFIVSRKRTLRPIQL